MIMMIVFMMMMMMIMMMMMVMMMMMMMLINAVSYLDSPAMEQSKLYTLTKSIRVS